MIILFDNLSDALGIIKNGEIKPVMIGGKPLGLARAGDELYIFERSCPHAAYDLTTGKLSPLGSIVCPWHNYQFQLNDGMEISNRCSSLPIRKAFLNEAGNVCYTPWS